MPTDPHASGREPEEPVMGGVRYSPDYKLPMPVAARCPVCSGKGIVPNGFYLSVDSTWTTSSTEPETCRSCGGTGVVWRP